MKTSQNGSAVVLLSIIVILLAVAFGAYIYYQNRPSQSATSPTSTGTSTPIQNIQPTTPSGPISVADMQKYTETAFGFSFWYPTNWAVTVTPVQNPNKYIGGTVAKQLNITNGQRLITVEEFTSPAYSISDSTGVGACPVCVPTHYYFDSSLKTWMVQYPPGTPSGGSGSPAPANVSNNTMGGLHLLAGSQRFGANVIIPLSASNFVVVTVDGAIATGSSDPQALAKTIVALDPKVATPLSVPAQTQVIATEANTFAQLSTDTGWQTYTNTQYSYQLQYPSDFTKNPNTSGDSSNPSLEIDYPASYYALGTNLSNAFITVSTWKTSENSCRTEDGVGNHLAPGLDQGKPATTEINGITFYTGHTGDSAMGHYGDESYLNTYYKNLCYSIQVTAVGAKQCFADAPNGPSCINPVPAFSLDNQILPTFLLTATTFTFTN